MFRVSVLALLMGWLAGVVCAEELPLMDPMQPFQAARERGTRGSAPARYRLTAVLISELRRIAVINGKLYREGDELDGARLTRIESQAVSLRRGSEDMVLRLSTGRPESQLSQGDSAL